MSRMHVSVDWVLMKLRAGADSPSPPPLTKPIRQMRRASRSYALLVGCLAIACTHGTSTSTPAPDRGSYDVVIENGRIVDGTGNPWTYGDVGIRGDRIVAVTQPGVLRNVSAKQRVDARGQVVPPGFIDIQAHSWEELLWRDGRVVSKVTQGVTSEILGEATTPAPSNDKMDSLSDIGEMEPPRAALQRPFRGG